MKTLTTNDFNIATEFYHSTPNVRSFEYRFVWKEFAFRYVIKYQ